MPNPWFRFYHEALDDPKVQSLPAELFKDWLNILCLACRNDGVLPPLNDLVFSLRKTPDETEKTLADLTAAQLIDRSKSGKLRPHKWDSRQFKSDHAYERVKRFRKRFKGVSETLHETDQIQIQNRTDTSVGFTEFWSAYPRKVKKAEALKTWKKIGPNGDLAKILEAIEREKNSAEWRKDGGTFIPHPTSWLNGHRWNDEPTAILPKPAKEARLVL